MDSPIAYEPEIRLFVFLFVFAAMATAETLWPRRGRVLGRGRRWLTNLAIVAINSFVVRLIFPVLAVGAGLWATQNGYGLLPQLALPYWIKGIIAVVVLDLAIYFQHVVSHKVALLWRLHQVHHADRDIDVTTGARFHPLEIMLSMAWKLVVVTAIGAPPEAVFVFEVILNGMAMFNHANVHLPSGLDRLLRLLIVTPDFHRVHHSVIRRETDSNYGFNLSIWDRLFGTYIGQPEKGHDAMTIGLPDWQRDEPANLLWCLLMPFRSGRTRG